MPLSELTSRRLKVAFVLYPCTGLIFFALQNIGFHFTNVYIENLAWLIFVPSMLFLFSWMIFLKSKPWRIVGRVINGLWLIPASLLLVWLLLWTFNDLKIGNGHKFESKQMVKGREVWVYRTPDEGTFGGRKPYACTYKKVLPGIEYRKVLDKEWLPEEYLKELER